MASRTSWWVSKARQLGRHVVARVGEAERTGLDGWTSPAQRALFDGMPVADRRHGLDVVATLRAAGVADPEVLLAGLLHDAGKGPTIRLWHRVAWSLGEALGPWATSAAARLPGGRSAMARLRDHGERSAEIALAVGCTPRTAALIRGAAPDGDREVALLLQRADEAS